jgi:hypothetical protein
LPLAENTSALSRWFNGAGPWRGTGGTQPRGTPSAQAAAGVVLAGVAPRGRKTHWLAVHGLRSCRSPFFLPGAKFSAFFLLALSRAQSFTAQAWTIRTALRPVAWMASLPETRRSSAQALQAAEKPRRLIHPPRRVCTRSLVLMGRPKRRCTVTWRRMAADGRSPFC